MFHGHNSIDHNINKYQPEEYESRNFIEKRPPTVKESAELPSQISNRGTRNGFVFNWPKGVLELNI